MPRPSLFVVYFSAPRNAVVNQHEEASKNPIIKDSVGESRRFFLFLTGEMGKMAKTSEEPAEIWGVLGR